MAVSIIVGIVSFLKTHYEQKARTPSVGRTTIAATDVLGLRALLFSVTRIGCVYAFFCPWKGQKFWPFQGLADRLAHWQAEAIQLDRELLKNLRSIRSTWDRETVDLIYREQDFTNYTLVTIQAAYFIFLGVILLHGIVIFVLKRNLSSHFKSASWLNKIGHVVGSLHVPETVIHDVYNMSYGSLLKKTLLMTFLQMFSNILLLVPLLVTGGIQFSFEIH